jgi:hypothetical protein
VGKQRQKARWSVEQRLEFIDFRLYWEGRVNRSDLIDFFEVSVPQASADLTQYQEQAKGNAVYDKTRKAYVAGPKFRPVFFDPSADQYLAQLRMIQSGLLPEEEAWAVRLPSYSILPILRRRIDPNTLRLVLTAIRSGEALHVSYQSMSAPQPKQRWLAPHALGFDGARWHARAWCFKREAFRDFVLSRVVAIDDARPSPIAPADDVGWQREVTLRIGPHPALKDGKRRAVELDYGMSDGVFEVATRACLAYYCMRQFGLDRPPTEVKPERQQIVLVNRAEVEAVMAETGVCGPEGLGDE